MQAIRHGAVVAERQSERLRLLLDSGTNRMVVALNTSASSAGVSLDL